MIKAKTNLLLLTSALLFITVNTASGQTQSAEVLNKMDNATVMVITHLRVQGELKPMGSGSGYFLNRTGLCMTNNHVVDMFGHMAGRWANLYEGWKWRELAWFVVVNSGTPEEEMYRAEVMYRNDLADQAIIQVYEDWDSRTYLRTDDFLRIRDTRTVDIGTKVFDWGFPGGDRRKLKKGSGKDEGPEHARVIFEEGPVVGFSMHQDGSFRKISTELQCDPGNSGGPVVDIEGKLVGTATLKPVTDKIDRAHQTDLVPADITKKILQTAFQLGRLGADIDLEPFYALLTGLDGYMHIPTFPRDEECDCFYWEGGQRICGEIEDDTLTFSSLLGELDIPVTNLAYLLPDEDNTGAILLDGGQRIPLLYEDLELSLKLEDGKTYETSFDRLLAVAFSKNHPLPAHPEGMGFLLDGPEYNLYLSDVEGKVEFESVDGITRTASLSDIRSIQTNENGDQLVTFADGSILAGHFSEEPKIKAKFMVSDEMHDISLKPASGVDIAEVDFGVREQFKRRISDFFQELLSEDLLEIATLIDKNEITGARRKIKQYSSDTYLKSANRARRDQVNLLRGIIDWREGKYDDSLEILKSLKYAEDDHIANYARSILTVADEFPDFKYDEKPLSDPQTFQLAANGIASGILYDALSIINEREILNLGELLMHDKLQTRSQFFNLRNKILNSKKKLDIAGQLNHPMAAWAYVQLLTIEEELYIAEMNRLKRVLENPEQERKDKRPSEREMEKVKKALEQTEEWQGLNSLEIRDFQFLNSDPNLEIPE